MKKLWLIPLVIILTGCGGGLKSSWNNFTAYYNTYYNAKNDYRAGLNKINAQPVQINPDMPVRAHPAPANAGREDFEEAIAKGAQILRRHSESKWADDALLLIGKSYYYRQEYFLAIQTFEDLLNFGASANLHQQATIWKGRSLLDISSYGEGVSFLESQLSAYEGAWDPKKKAEAQIVLAEHHAMLQNWSQAAKLLEDSFPEIDDRPFKARSYFLLGQVLQQQGDFNRALWAYSNVASNFPDYEYIYWAGVKRAQVARLDGNADLAISIYRSMLKDDKNFDRSNELYFQLGQTLEQQGDIRQAEAIYKQILTDDSPNNNTNISADIYYQLGQLYSNSYNDYELAAAYFDSSSLQSSRESEEILTENATSLASAYGDYVSLKSQISRIDSLLALGRLDEQELDSVLTELRRRKRAEQRRDEATLSQTGNTLTNINQNRSIEEAERSSGPSSFGFLNYRNARMVQDARQQFKAVWGERPLVDNWRRTNAILSTSGNDQTRVSEESGAGPDILERDSNEETGLDLQGIPRTEQARVEKKQERLMLEYRLGNLFFLTLNQADSAKKYFKTVLEDSISTEVKPKSLYSLVKLYELQEQADSAAFYRRRILEEYPVSVFAERIENQPEQESKIGYPEVDSTAVLRERVQEILPDESTAPPSPRRAEQLRNLALENRNSELAASIYYRGIREYIRVAKSIPSDSAKNIPLRYSGKDWDRVRGLLQEFRELFPDATQIQQVNTWMKTLSTPAQDAVLSCRELEIEPTVKPDMQSFVNSVELPPRVKALRLSGSLEYQLLINKDGTVESYKLLSNPTSLGIEQTYEEAFKNKLRFEPITRNGQPLRVSCDVAFPIKQ